jgi:hypothetical protein
LPALVEECTEDGVADLRTSGRPAQTRPESPAAENEETGPGQTSAARIGLDRTGQGHELGDRLAAVGDHDFFAALRGLEIAAQVSFEAGNADFGHVTIMVTRA